MKKKTLQPIRSIIQAAFVLYLAWFAFSPAFSGNGWGGSVHSICPFASIETMPTFLASGGTSFVRGASPNNFVVTVSLIVTILIAGAAFCGWLCPVGTIGEWLFKLRKLFWKKNINLPDKVHKAASWLRYVFLAVILVMCFLTVSLWFAKVDPFFNLFSLKLFTTLGLAVAVVFIAGSMLIDRFFCNYLCPLGAVIKPVAKLAAVGIVRNEQICTSCKACDKACPKRIPVSRQSKIDRGECISCMRCIESCPVSGTLEEKIGW